ncbi:hypothetical protein F511_07099 [Dorcoceras hygrometricum]|nr:hypothetical protein F511_07099 [Dorcoceras hygrometricum]
MQRHTDYGFLPKTQPDPNLVVHVSLYRRSKYSITRIMVLLRIMDVTSGPDLNQAYSYTSILRLGLAIGHHPRTLREEIGRWTEDSFLVREYRPRPHYHFENIFRGLCLDVMKSLAQKTRRSIIQSPVARRSRAPRRGGVCSSAEVIWLHQIDTPTMGDNMGA